MRLAVAIASISCCLAVWGCGDAPSGIGVGSAVRCSAAARYVPVGGTAGFDTLARPGFTTLLRATGRARLYEHANAVAAAIADSPPAKPYRILHAIESAFRGSSAGEAELGYVGASYFTLPAKDYPQYYQYQYASSGLDPVDANVNVPDGPPAAIELTKKTARLWKEWVNAGRSAGIESMAPIVAPNAAWKPHSKRFPPTRHEYYDFNSSFYSLARFEATYGGAIAFDAPPHFFLTGGSGRGYQRFIEQAIRWGDDQAIRTTMLVSPYPNRRNFSNDTKTFAGVLAARGALPSEWAVDDYENVKANDARAMGPETRENTVTNVALWLAQYAPVASCR